MRKFLSTAILFALPVALAGCDKAADTPKAEVSADTMGEMTMPGEMRTAMGSGTVTAIDAAAGRITLDHEPIAELEWPAMEMGFAINADKLNGIAVGDAVTFDMQWDGRTGEITSLTKDR